MAKKCTKKRDACAKLLFCQSKHISLLPFLMPLPSSLLKLPIDRCITATQKILHMQNIFATLEMRRGDEMKCVLQQYCSWDRYWGHASKVLAIFSPVFAKVSKLDPVSLAIAHFTVTGENKAGVDLGLIQPSLLYYVNQVFLMLITYFLA